MTLGAPLGLLALLGAVPLVAAYFLRRKQPPFRVSAVFLWRDPSLRAEGGPRLSRFTRERSLLLELLALTLGALFLADARCGQGAAQRPPLAVVVDSSLSMSAHLPGHRSAGERAVAMLRVRLAEAGPVTLVQSGRPSRLLAGPAASADTARRALETYRAQQGDHPFAEGLALARSLSGASRVLLLTDHVPAEALPDWVELEALGEALENDAITYAERHDQAGEAKLVVRMTHFGATSATLRLDVTAPSDEGGAPVRESRTVEVGPGKSHVVQATLAHAGPAEVRLTRVGPAGPDGLEADGTLTLHKSPERPLAVAVLPGLPEAERSALERFVEGEPGLSLDPEAPLLRFGGPHDPSATVVFAAAGERRAFLGPFFVEGAHPLLEDVDTRGVVWSAGATPEGRPLISAGGRALLTETREGTLVFNLDLSRSNLARATAWPVLLSNLVRRARVRLPGFERRHVFLGEEVALEVPSGTHHLVAPDGTRTALSSGPRALQPPTAAGTYRLEGAGGEVGRLEVLPLDPSESDLRAQLTSRRPATVTDKPASAPLPARSTWPLAALLGVLLLDYRGTRGRA